MSFEQLADLAMAAVPRGRPAKQMVVKGRELRAEDMAKLANRRGVPRNPLTRIRDTHHYAARMIAAGHADIDTSLATGYSPQYISALKREDPSFKELVEHYKVQVNAQFLNVHERLAMVGLNSLGELQHRLESEPESFSNGELQELTKLSLDRSGFGPTSKQIVQDDRKVTVEIVERVKAELTSRGQVRQLEEVIEVPLLAAE